MAKRKKPKIHVKSVHSMSLHEHITNSIPIKNKVSKKKKKKISIQSKSKKSDYEKVLRFKKEIEFSDDEILYDAENENEANTFLEFDDDIHMAEEENEHDDSDEQLFQKYEKTSFDETNEVNDIFKEYDIPIETEIGSTNCSVTEQTKQEDKPLEIVEKCYKIIGEQLAVYTNGKIHSAFIILTRSPRWYELILLTNPENWSKYATFEATKIFSSGLKDAEVPKFYEYILLPKILNHIEEHKRLDGVLYQTLIKALYKPIPWFKGILFPLIKKECHNKVLMIIGSIIKRMSINVKYAMMGVKLMFDLKERNLSSLFYFLCFFLDKKYKFTRDFITDCINFFLNFATYKKALPLVWHKSLLLLVQNYKDLLNDEQRKNLQDLVTKKHHHKISVEILKSLFSTSVVINKMRSLREYNPRMENEVMV